MLSYWRRPSSTALHGRHDRGEVVVGEHHVRGAPRHVGAADPHRDPDVGLLERGGVVHAVAGHRDDLSQLLQSTHDPQLVLGGRTREEHVLRQGEPQLAVLHRIELGPRERPRRRQPDLARDGQGGRGGVSGDHDHADSGAARQRHRRGHLGSRRVEDAHDAQQGEAPLQLLPLSDDFEIVRQPSPRQRQRAQAESREVLVGPRRQELVRLAEGANRLAFEDVGAARQDLLGCALHVEHPAVRAALHDRHALAPGIEGKLEQQRRIGGALQARLACHHQERCLRGLAQRLDAILALGEPRVIAAHTRGEQRVQVWTGAGIHHNAVALEPARRRVADARHDQLAGGQPHPLYGHLVLRERPGLVGADHARLAEGLGGGEASQQRAPPHHRADADRQRDGDERRQALRHHGDGQGDAGEEHVEGGLAEPPAGDRHECRDRQAEDAELLAQDAEALLQRRASLVHRAGEPGDAPELRAEARGHDEAPRAAARHRRAHPEHAASRAQRGIGRHRPFALRDGLRFAGEHRLVHAQLRRLHDAQVGGNPAAGLESDDVAGDECAGVECRETSVSQDRAARRQHPAQRTDRPLGAPLLGESEQTVEDEDRQDGDGVRRFTHGRRHSGRHCEDCDQDVDELAREQSRPVRALVHLESVRAVSRQTRDRLRRLEPALESDAQTGRRVGGIHGVPGDLGAADVVRCHVGGAA
jgi:hypothetical protein